MQKGKTDPSVRKTIAKVSVLLLGLGLGMSLLISGGTFAKWTSAISQMTGANIQIGDWIAVEPPVISTDSNLPDGRVGIEYRHQLEASNSEKATWSYQRVSDNLPSGMTLSRDGLISGIPTVVNTYIFKATVTNIAGSDERSFTFVVHPVGPVFAESQVLPDAFDGKAYQSITLTASGHSKRFEVTSGALPSGMTLSSTGTISGTPVGYGLFTFTVKASNSGGSDSREFSINLNSDFPYITTNALPDATKSNWYSQILAGSGPSPTYTVVDGKLPNGMSIDAATGRISGMANFHGLSNFTISKTNSMGTDTKELSIYTRYAAPTITTSSLSTVRKNVPYSRQLEGIGEESTFAISEGSLPAGITLHPVTGLFSGVATEIGKFDLTVTRTNESGVATRTFVLHSILAAPVITSNRTMPYGYVGSFYEMKNTATGEEITWGANGLPEGLSIDSVTGIISGTPTIARSQDFYLTASNSGGLVNERLSLTIRNAPPVIVTTSIPDAEVGQFYSEQISVIGNGVSYRIQGSLPTGMTLSASGAISGTPTIGGTFTFILIASNNGGSVDLPITLFVERDMPTFATTSLNDGTQTIHYGQSVTGKGVDSRHTVTSGSLPPGLSLNPTTGFISGTPSANVHGAYVFTITKINSRGTAIQDFTINIHYQSPTITTTSVSQGFFNVAYSYTLAGVGNGATYVITDGLLPAGINIDNTGKISGAPTVTGNFPFTVQKSNDRGTVSRDYVFSIVHVAPKITSTAFDRATIGVPYSMQVQASGLDVVYSFSGSLPAGLALDATTGIISGTPTVAGNIYVTLYANNSGGRSTMYETFYVTHIAPIMITTSLPVATVGTPYSETIEVTGEEITFRGDYLPSGLSINSRTGVISGTPTSVINNSSTRITVKNTGGSVEQYIPMTVLPQAPTITRDTIPDGVLGKTYSQTLSGAGSSNTFTITDGQLPPGIYMSNLTGSLSGTPTSRGSYTFTVTKTNVSGTVSKEFTLNIKYVLPTITTTSGPLAAARVGQNYSILIYGAGDAVTHSIADGTLPPGLVIETVGPNARIIGTPTTPSNYVFTIRKSNLDGEVSREFSINIVPPVTPASLSSESGNGLLLLRSNLY